MITLEQEAEELYPDNEYPIFGEELRSAFIDGSKSKYVEKEKLKAIIDELSKIKENMTLYELSHSDITQFHLNDRIQELKLKLGK